MELSDPTINKLISGILLSYGALRSTSVSLYRHSLRSKVNICAEQETTMKYEFDTPYVLIDTTECFKGELALSSADFPDSSDQPWSLRMRKLRGGKQEGVALITIDNGALQMRVIPTRGMSILDVQADTWRWGWDSPVKEVVHPHFINLHDRGGLGWLDGFNEWLVRCGLEFAGHPGIDRVVNNAGDLVETPLALHGKIGNIPASRVELIVDSAPPHTLHLVGYLHEHTFHGPKLSLCAAISLAPGAPELEVRDTITNHSAMPQEFQIIYHTNFGPPLLADGSQFVAAVKSVKPFNDRSAQNLLNFTLYSDPQPGFIEEVYLAELHGDQHGETQAMLKNPSNDLAAVLKWKIDELPYFTLWKNSAALADGYVTGLEPGTSFPFNRSVERAHGRTPILAPGESRSLGVKYSMCVGREAVTQQEYEISSQSILAP